MRLGRVYQRRLTNPLCVDGFLRDAACQRLLEELDFAYWNPSTVVNRSPVGGVVARRSTMRVSETTTEDWFTPSAERMARHVRERIAALLKVSPVRFEPWQAVRYRCGGKFDYHLDAGLWSNEPAGERVWTALVYLDTPSAGGATRFKELGLSISAIGGRLLLWKNLLSDGTPNPWMLHRGVPVRKGRKTILVTWIRQRRFKPNGGTDGQ
jgi:prolyl 4-hydroxylase